MIVGQSHYLAGKKYCRRCECYTYNHKVFITKIKRGKTTVTLYYNSILKTDMVKATCLSS